MHLPRRPALSGPPPGLRAENRKARLGAGTQNSFARQNTGASRTVLVERSRQSMSSAAPSVPSAEMNCARAARRISARPAHRAGRSGAALGAPRASNPAVKTGQSWSKPVKAGLNRSKPIKKAGTRLVHDAAVDADPVLRALPDERELARREPERARVVQHRPDRDLRTANKNFLKSARTPRVAAGATRCRRRSAAASPPGALCCCCCASLGAREKPREPRRRRARHRAGRCRRTLACRPAPSARALPAHNGACRRAQRRVCGCGGGGARARRGARARQGPVHSRGVCGAHTLDVSDTPLECVRHAPGRPGPGPAAGAHLQDVDDAAHVVGPRVLLVVHHRLAQPDLDLPSPPAASAASALRPGPRPPRGARRAGPGPTSLLRSTAQTVSSSEFGAGVMAAATWKSIAHGSTNLPRVRATLRTRRRRAGAGGARGRPRRGRAALRRRAGTHPSL